MVRRPPATAVAIVRWRLDATDLLAVGHQLGLQLLPGILDSALALVLLDSNGSAMS